MENINEDEDCGCGGTTSTIRDYDNHVNYTSHDKDPWVGMNAYLRDGRSGKIDDSIRNNTGQVIGYVIEGDRGSFRVFKDKIERVEESEGAMASLGNTPGMGTPAMPTPDGKPGSGDKFPSLTVGTPAAKGKRKKSEDDEDEDEGVKRSGSLLDFKAFIKKGKNM
jgi:hypothetical protein